MFRTFNMGIGMIAIINSNDLDRAQKILKTHKIKSWAIGKVCEGRKVEVL